MLALDADKTVTATFAMQFTLTVNQVGQGTVRSGDDQVRCDDRCTVSLDAGNQVTLTARPASNVFAGWSGACSRDSRSSCIFMMSSDGSVSASFTASSSPAEHPAAAAQARDSSTVLLTWEDRTTNETGFQVLRAERKNGVLGNSPRSAPT